MPEVAGQPKDGDGQVTQAGHDAGPLPGEDLGSVLVAHNVERTLIRIRRVVLLGTAPGFQWHISWVASRLEMSLSWTFLTPTLLHPGAGGARPGRRRCHYDELGHRG
jgi:hypothetical protein